MKKEKQPGIIPTEDEAQLKPIRQHGVVLGPNMAKTTQLQSRTRVLQQLNFTIKIVATIHSPQWIRNRTPSIAMGNSDIDVAINSQPQ